MNHKITFIDIKDYTSDPRHHIEVCCHQCCLLFCIVMPNFHGYKSYESFFYKDDFKTSSRYWLDANRKDFPCINVDSILKMHEALG